MNNQRKDLQEWRNAGYLVMILALYLTMYPPAIHFASIMTGKSLRIDFGVLVLLIWGLGIYRHSTWAARAATVHLAVYLTAPFLLFVCAYLNCNFVFTSVSYPPVIQSWPQWTKSAAVALGILCYILVLACHVSILIKLHKLLKADLPKPDFNSKSDVEHLTDRPA